MSIVRVGLAETKHFAEGYEAIFGRKKSAKPKGVKAAAKPRSRKAKKPKKS